MDMHYISFTERIILTTRLPTFLLDLQRFLIVISPKVAEPTEREDVLRAPFFALFIHTFSSLACVLYVDTGFGFRVIKATSPNYEHR